MSESLTNPRSVIETRIQIAERSCSTEAIDEARRKLHELKFCTSCDENERVTSWHTQQFNERLRKIQPHKKKFDSGQPST